MSAVSVALLVSACQTTLVAIAAWLVASIGRMRDPRVLLAHYQGALFVAVPGFHVDGHAFAADAVSRGAAAVVAERAPQPPLPGSIPLVIVPDSRAAMAVSRSLLVAAMSRTSTLTVSVPPSRSNSRSCRTRKSLT